MRPSASRTPAANLVLGCLCSVSPEMAREYEDFLKNARTEIMGDPEAVKLMKRRDSDPVRQLHLQFQL
jgi:hypothetical protein